MIKIFLNLQEQFINHRTYYFDIKLALSKTSFIFKKYEQGFYNKDSLSLIVR